MPGSSVQRQRQFFRQQELQRVAQLLRKPAVLLAQIAAAGLECAAKRADGTGIRGAERDIATLEHVLANRATHFFGRCVERFRLPREIVFATRAPSDERCGGKSREQRAEWR